MIDNYIQNLRSKNYKEYATMIEEAQLSGSMASEILGLVSLELKKCHKEIDKSDQGLIDEANNILVEINKIFK